MPEDVRNEIQENPAPSTPGQRSSQRSIGARYGKGGNEAKKPVVYCPDAGQCEDCSDTCGPSGCSLQCSCFLTNELACEHPGPFNSFFYCCRSMLDRYPRKRVVCADEPFLVETTKPATSNKKAKPLDVPYSLKGLKALETFEEMDVIGEYTGPRIHYKKTLQWKFKLEQDDKYLMQTLNGEWLIDGEYGNELRYVNASCKPNAKFVEWGGYPDGEKRIFLIATKKIQPEEMIHVKNYGWSTGRIKLEVQCLCKLTPECVAGEVRL